MKKVEKLYLEATVYWVAGLLLSSSRSLMAELVAEFLPVPSVGLLSVVRSVFHGPDMTRKIIRAKSKTFQSERLKKSYFISWGSLKYVSAVSIFNFNLK